MMEILNRLALKKPIFLAPMAGVSTTELAAEVSNAGGLGALGLGASSADQAYQMIRELQGLTSSAFQVNFFCHRTKALDLELSAQWIEYLAPFFQEYNLDAPQNLHAVYDSFKDNDQFLELVLETRPAAVSFHFGLPQPHQIKALQQADILTMVSATSLAEAKAIEAAGIDVVIAQGHEAGGHRGCFNPNRDSGIKTTDLVELLNQHCALPIVAAGGIMNGRQAKRCLDRGAQAVQLGTAFVQCENSNASTAYREMLFDKPLTQITATISGRPARGLINRWHTDIDVVKRPRLPPYPYTYDIAKQLHQIAQQHNHRDFGAFWAGSNVAQIRRLSATDLLNLLVLEMNLEDERLREHQ